MKKLTELSRKTSAIVAIFTTMFSYISPVFALIGPTFTAVQTVANVVPGTDNQTATHAVVQSNVVEVKATRTLTVNSRPDNNESITIGQCVVSFPTIAGSTSDELDCSDNAASIDRNTGAGNNARDASTIAGKIRSVTNINTTNHGILVTSGSGATATFTTPASYTENTTNGINFVNGTGGDNDITSTSTTSATPPEKQITTITIGPNVDVGDTFTVTSAPFGTASFIATTTSSNDVASGLNTAIQAHANYPSRSFTTSVATNVITLTAKTAGTGFTSLTPSTTNFPGVAQKVTFTPAGVISGIDFTTTVNGVDFTAPTTSGASTVASVTAGLAPLITAGGAVTCTDDTTHITCTANVPGTTFTYSASWKDVEKPVITLNPVNPYALTVGGAAYVEPGATAVDNLDGDISVSISIDATAINQSLPGSYFVTYNVSDSAGNPATQENRTVNVSDVTGPVISGVPADITVEQVGTASAPVTYTNPTAVDDVTNPISVTCLPTSGSLFVYGLTAVLCSAQDAVPNISTASFNVTVQDTIAPTVTSVSITSNNANSSSLARAGDIITVSFTTSESVNTPTAAIAGKSATVTNVGGNDYTATYLLTAAETQGSASIAIDFSDIAGNAATQVTATTDASSVIVDTVAPTQIGTTVSPLNSSATVKFSTDENTLTKIDFGTTSAYDGSGDISNTLSVYHEKTLLNLLSCSTYHYSVTATDAAGNSSVSSDATFTTIGVGDCSSGGQDSMGSQGGSPSGGSVTEGPLQETPSANESTNTPPEETSSSSTETTGAPEETNTTNNTENTPTSGETPANTGGEGNTTPTEETTTGGNENIEGAGTTEENAAPNETGTEGGTEGTGEGTGTGGENTGGGTFNPASATLDTGGGTTPPTLIEPVTTQNTTEESIPEDVGGGTTPPEGDNNAPLVWTLLGIVALLNGWWYFATRAKVPPLIRH